MISRLSSTDKKINRQKNLKFNRLWRLITFNKQKQPRRGVPRNRCSENMQQIYRRTPMPKCNFNKVALQLY